MKPDTLFVKGRRTLWRIRVLTALAGCITTLTACNYKTSYWLNRDTAANAIQRSGEFQRLIEVEFTTGRQTFGNSVGATTALESADGGGTDSPFCPQDDPAGLYTSAPCVPRDSPNLPALESGRDRDTKNTPCVSLPDEKLGCYFNWVAPRWEPLLANYDDQHILTKVRITTPTRNCPTQNHWGQEWRCLKDTASRLGRVDCYEYFVRIGQPVVEVTGIFKDVNHAKVQFQWGFLKVNELGRALHVPVPDLMQHHLDDVDGGTSLSFTGEASVSNYDDGWRITGIQLHGWLYGPEPLKKTD